MKKIHTIQQQNYLIYMEIEMRRQTKNVPYLNFFKIDKLSIDVLSKKRAIIIWRFL